MEIVKERAGNVTNVRVSGRLDNHWSRPFDDALDEVLREGARHVRLDLTGVSYLSSAAVDVLMKAYRETAALQGTLLLSAASDGVRNVLRLMELEDLLFGSPAAEVARRRTLSVPLPVASQRASYESRRLEEGRAVCRLVGDPSAREQSFSIDVERDLFALGVGALGSSHEECREIFGEFVAVGGSAAFMPTDGTSTPDYMSSSGAFAPQMQALYAIVFQGSPGHLLRFEASTPGGGVALNEIVRTCASLAGTPQFGLVMAAEVMGLMCVRLRQSPARGDGVQFDFPAVREWLSFTPEREHAGTSSVVVGFVSSSPSAAMRPFLRPVGDGFHGHFHAAVAAFHSLPRGAAIADVAGLAFQPRSVLSVVHLLRDRFTVEGGDSEFFRGTCWVFPIDSGDAP